MKVGFNKTIPTGYTIYGYNTACLMYHVCKWYLYPIFRTGWLIITLKYSLYRWLNKKGIMHTPETRKMIFNDLFKKPEKPFKYENVIAGYLMYDDEVEP
jgi:hypothetical protein